MKKVLKYTVVFGIQLIAACLFLYVTIKYLLRSSFQDASVLIIIAVLGFAIGIIYFIKKERGKGDI